MGDGGWGGAEAGETTKLTEGREQWVVVVRQRLQNQEAKAGAEAVAGGGDGRGGGAMAMLKQRSYRRGRERWLFELWVGLRVGKRRSKGGGGEGRGG